MRHLFCVRSLFLALVVAGSALLFTSHARAEDDLMGSYERAQICYKDVTCRPTMSKQALEAMDIMKCYIKPECKGSITTDQMASLERLKMEFPANDSATAYYQRLGGGDRKPASAKAGGEAPAAASTEKKKPAPAEEVWVNQKTTLGTQWEEVDPAPKKKK